MNEFDKHTLLIDNLLKLEEDLVLAQVKERLQQQEDPFEIIEEAQRAMILVGKRYEQGEYYISSMMMAGEIFREVMEIIEPVIVQQVSKSGSGKILLGTVQGDIHDIGKNIFEILLRAHGFTVLDIGVDVPPETFAQKAQQFAPDIIALSGLLTIAYDSMKETIRQIKNSDHQEIAQTPFIIGGGVVNDMVCAYVGADFWAIDAMVGVQICQQIIAQ